MSLRAAEEVEAGESGRHRARLIAYSAQFIILRIFKLRANYFRFIGQVPVCRRSHWDYGQVLVGTAVDTNTIILRSNSVDQ